MFAQLRTGIGYIVFVMKTELYCNLNYGTVGPYLSRKKVMILGLNFGSYFF